MHLDRLSFGVLLPWRSAALYFPWPVVVFLDRGHPCFRSTIPVDVVRVKSYVNRLFDAACVPMRITINKLNCVTKQVVSGVVSVF